MAEAEGIPPTASTIVPGLSLNYLGDWCYAYSGLLEAKASAYVFLEFTTGSGFIVGVFQWDGFVDQSDPTSGNESTARIIINGINTMILKTATREEDQQSPVRERVILPPFTKIQVRCDASSDSTLVGSMNFTGRVYDA